jgi:hypothetical protein
MVMNFYSLLLLLLEKMPKADEERRCPKGG